MRAFICKAIIEDTEYDLLSEGVNTPSYAFNNFSEYLSLEHNVNIEQAEVLTFEEVDVDYEYEH